MTSEIENILRGRVETSPNYQARVIAVKSQNLMADATGIAPLSKTNAFIKEEVNNANNQIESLDFLMRPESSIKSEMKAPEYSDVTLENPVEVANTKDLSDFNMTASSEVVNNPVAEVQTNTYAPIDIQMPQMPERIVALEPKEVNPNMFEATNNETNQIAQTPMFTSELVNNNEVVIDGAEDIAATMVPPVVNPVPETAPVVEQTSVNPEPVQSAPVAEEEIVLENPVAEAMTGINNEEVDPIIDFAALSVPPVVNPAPVVEPVNPVPTVIDGAEDIAATMVPPVVNPSPVETEMLNASAIEDKNKELIDNAIKSITEEVNKIITAKLNELALALSEGKTVENPIENKVTEEVNPLMSDALAQINNMIIPSNEGPRL